MSNKLLATRHTLSSWLKYYVLFGGFLVSIQQAWGQDPKGILPDEESNKDLADKIKLGTVGTEDIPAIILHAVDFFLRIAGGIAVIMIMVGGVQMILGGITENKDSGKKTLKYAIMGLFVAFLSWFVVDQIQKYLTAQEV